MNPTRQKIKQGYFDDMVADALALAGIHPLSSAQRRVSLDRTLSHRPRAADLWVFAYGSLIWNPCFHFVERRPAVLHGHHRALCLWDPLARGTPARPGLLFGLDRGGACKGLVFRIGAEAEREETELIWSREMVAGPVYEPRWVTARTAAGPVRAIAFVMDRTSCLYAGKLPHGEVVAAVAHGRGRLGSCAEYVRNTVEALSAHGIDDPKLGRTWRMADAVIRR